MNKTAQLEPRQKVQIGNPAVVFTKTQRGAEGPQVSQKFLDTLEEEKTTACHKIDSGRLKVHPCKRWSVEIWTKYERRDWKKRWFFPLRFEWSGWKGESNVTWYPHCSAWGSDIGGVRERESSELCVVHGWCWRSSTCIYACMHACGDGRKKRARIEERGGDSRAHFSWANCTCCITMTCRLPVCVSSFLYSLLSSSSVCFLRCALRSESVVCVFELIQKIHPRTPPRLTTIFLHNQQTSPTVLNFEFPEWEISQHKLQPPCSETWKNENKHHFGIQRNFNSSNHSIVNQLDRLMDNTPSKTLLWNSSLGPFYILNTHNLLKKIILNNGVFFFW